MADPTQQGPLTQVSPAASMTPIAAAGNSFLQGMLQNTLANSQAKQDYIKQQQDAYSNDMDQYSKMVDQSRDPNSSINQAGLWGSIAKGAAMLPQTAGNIGAQLANMGAGAAQFVQSKQQGDLENQQKLTKTREDNLRTAEAHDQQAQLMRSMQAQQGKLIHITDDAGNTYLSNNVTGAREVIPTTHAKEWNTAMADGLKVAIAEDAQDKGARQLQYARDYMANIPGGIVAAPGQVTTPGASQVVSVNSQTPANPAQSAQVTPQAQKDVGTPLTDGTSITTPQDTMAHLDKILSPQDLATVNRLFKRIQANPSAAENDTKTLQGILDKYTGSGASLTTADAADTSGLAPPEQSYIKPGEALSSAQTIDPVGNTPVTTPAGWASVAKMGDNITPIAAAKARAVAAETQAKLDVTKANATPSVLPPGQDEEQYIQNAAARFNIVGALPTNIGRGAQGAAITQRILQEAARQNATSGMTPDQRAIQQVTAKKTISSYTGDGKDAAQIQSANIGLNHLDTLKQLADAQHQGDWPRRNGLFNAIGAELGQSAPTNMQGAIMMVAPEISKAVVGSGSGGVEDRKQATDVLETMAKGSPEQVSGQVATLQDLFGGRLIEKQRAYERGTGLHDFATPAFLSPAAQRILAEKQARQVASSPSPVSTPSAASMPDDIAALLKKHGGSKP
jgi:hypothetical protein